jgi:hypothetical protein
VVARGRDIDLPAGARERGRQLGGVVGDAADPTLLDQECDV